MPIQIQATKQASKINNRARQITYDMQDAQTDGVIMRARMSIAKARIITERAEQFLSSLES